MQRGRVLNLRFFNKFIQFMVKNKLLIILTAFFIAGFCAAVFTYGKYDFLTEWSESHIQSFIAEHSTMGFLKMMIDSFLTSMLFIVLCFICGTSMMGVLLIPVCVAARAFIYGTTAAYLYSAYSFTGVAFHAIILLPPAILFIIAFVLSSIEAVRFSFVLAGLTFSRNTAASLYLEFKQYCIRFLLFSLFVLASSIVDAILSLNFLGNFNL